MISPKLPSKPMKEQTNITIPLQGTVVWREMKKKKKFPQLKSGHGTFYLEIDERGLNTG